MSNAAHNYSSLQTASDLGFLIAPGQEQIYLDMESALGDFLKPAAGIETYLFREVLRGHWNLHRCQRAEMHLARAQSDPGIDPLLDDTNEKPYRRIRQFERTSRGSLYKALQKLAEIQTEVRYRLQAFPPTERAPIADQPPHRFSVLCKTSKVLAGALTTGKTAIQRAVPLAEALKNLFSQSAQPSAKPNIDKQSEPQAASAEQN